MYIFYSIYTTLLCVQQLPRCTSIVSVEYNLNIHRPYHNVYMIDGVTTTFLKT